MPKDYVLHVRLPERTGEYVKQRGNDFGSITRYITRLIERDLTNNSDEIMLDRRL